MADTKFDSKSFNAEAFGAYVKNVPNTKKNELIKSKALVSNPEIRKVFSSQTGTNYARIPMFGNIGGDAQVYDGNTDFVPESTVTYEQGVAVYGLMKAWTERDFSYDITGGVDFMDNIAKQVSEYWDAQDQDILLAVLSGIFSMTGTANLKFVNGHTLDISANTDETGKVGATSLNTAIQQACGDNKNTFSIVIMHSAVATNLENLNLLKHLTYTDAQGVTRDLSLGTWNGRTVLIDDSMPVSEQTDYTAYTTYILGDGAISFEDIGAKVPYEMGRDPKTNGGEDTLYSRQRKCLAPKGISFKAGVSATKTTFAAGANWSLVSDGGSNYFDHKGIPIARIVSRG